MCKVHNKLVQTKLMRWKWWVKYINRLQYNLNGLGWRACPLALFGPALLDRVGLSEWFNDGIETERTKHSAGNDIDDVIVVALVIFGAFQNCYQNYEKFKFSQQIQNYAVSCDERNRSQIKSSHFLCFFFVNYFANFILKFLPSFFAKVKII